tara:strand:- start:537 stop:734 length:198 start_codon:yes stop_codon:yes gene_type:complete
MEKIKNGTIVKRSKTGKLALIVDYDYRNNMAKVKNVNGVLEWIDEAVIKVSWFIKLWAKIRLLFK